jgi:hypothetical protein
MKELQVRFTTQEKFSILREIDLIGMEPLLKKYCLNVKHLSAGKENLKKPRLVIPFI